METDGDRFSARFLSDSFLSFPAFLRSLFSCLFASWSRLVFINSKNVDGVSTTSIYTLRNPYQGKPESYIILNPHTCRRREKGTTHHERRTNSSDLTVEISFDFVFTFNHSTVNKSKAILHSITVVAIDTASPPNPEPSPRQTTPFLQTLLVRHPNTARP